MSKAKQPSGDDLGMQPETRGKSTAPISLEDLEVQIMASTVYLCISIRTDTLPMYAFRHDDKN